ARRAMRYLHAQRSRIASDLDSLGEHERPATHLNESDLTAQWSATPALRAALAELPPRQRVALALKYVAGLTDSEIAAALDCPRMIVTLALALAVFGSAFAYPTTRDALDTFFSGGAIPGGQKDLGGLPGWLDNTARTRPAKGTPRLLAEQDGQKLYAYRDANSRRACL